nr:MAG TPA: SOS-response transcriptional repressor [Caudoviricetes sp.]
MVLSFAEQVRTILHRKNMTVDNLAGILGMSRQNLWQQLNRDNFKEGDMRKIAEALSCDLSIELRETAELGE